MKSSNDTVTVSPLLGTLTDIEIDSLLTAMREQREQIAAQTAQLKAILADREKARTVARRLAEGLP